MSGEFLNDEIDRLKQENALLKGKIEDLETEIAHRWMIKVEDLEKENKILQKKASGTLANNLCPDCRDKIAGKSCLRCEIQRLERLLKAAYTQAYFAGEDNLRGRRDGPNVSKEDAWVRWAKEHNVNPFPE